MPLGSGHDQIIDSSAGSNEPKPLDKNSKIPRLTAAELRELARILHEMLRRDLLLERDRMGR